MTLAVKTATALALVLALAGCGGGAEEASEPAATPEAVETAAPSDTATPAPGETPTPGATPSAPPSATPSPTATATSAAPSPTPVAAAGPPTVFNQCTACHSVERGENGLGPSLAGVFGRRAAAVPGFTYSQAMEESGLTWNQGNLDRFLENPRGVVAGTTMAYNGVKDAAQRRALIDYLKTL